MKILLVDDDRVAREIVKRLLTRIADSVVEAGDGLQALEVLEREDPDFVFTDAHMPVMSGLELVEAIRGSGRWSGIPVVCLSDVRGREEFERFRRLGVADYILKPVRPQSAYDRFRAVIAAHAGWRQRQSVSTNRTLLLVDNDPNFRAFAKNVLLLDFAVIECHAGHEAARLYQRLTPKPDTIVMSNRLDLPSAPLLVALVQRLAADAKVQPPAMILTADQPPGADTAALFTGVLQRSFVPDAFLRDFRRCIFGPQSPWEKLATHVRQDGTTWLETGIRQTLGVMAGRDAIAVAAPNVALEEGVATQIRLELRDAGTLIIHLSASLGDATQLARAVLRHDDVPPDAAREVFAELINVIGGRTRASLGEAGWDLALCLPETADVRELASTTWDHTVWMSARDVGRFRVGLRLQPDRLAEERAAEDDATLSGVFF